MSLCLLGEWCPGLNCVRARSQAGSEAGSGSEIPAVCACRCPRAQELRDAAQPSSAGQQGPGHVRCPWEFSAPTATHMYRAICPTHPSLWIVGAISHITYACASCCACHAARSCRCFKCGRRGPAAPALTACCRGGCRGHSTAHRPQVPDCCRLPGAPVPLEAHVHAAWRGACDRNGSGLRAPAAYCCVLGPTAAQLTQRPPAAAAPPPRACCAPAPTAARSCRPRLVG